MSDKPQDEKAWSEFWARNARKGGGGCMPQRWVGIEQAQKAAWKEFIASVEGKPRVLDLATGDGRVLYWLMQMRPGITATGTDLAPQLPPPPPGADIRAGVAMENLPFADDSFDIVTSQFGFEYGETSLAAAEIARVIVPGGKVGLMIHRSDGPILEHNAVRRAQILWLLEESGLFETVSAAFDAGGDGSGAAIDKAQRIRGEGMKLWGKGSVGWEIPEAVHRTLLYGANGPRAKLLGTLELIEREARNEIGRIESLAHACQTADKRDSLLADLNTAGLQLENEVSVDEPSGRAFAAFLSLRAS